MVELTVETALPGRLSLQNPNRYLVEGWIFGRARLTSLSVRVGERSFPARYTEIRRPEVARSKGRADRPWSLFSGFAVPVFLEPVEAEEELPVALEASFADGERLAEPLGTLTLTPWRQDEQCPLPLPAGADPDKLVVIAMATYNPEREGFRRQIDSIRQQEYRDWLCLVCDDRSQPEKLAGIREVLGDDPRFVLLENGENVGAYRNFERCLERVPCQARYVAMSDQDDYWYPDKLSRSVALLTGETRLAFCDMRIVGHDGRVLSDSFWGNRTNYYRKEDLDLLALANTVSATASVFRRELLDRALPFPGFGGNLHHDKWLAIMAAATGGIAYLDSPLYDYIQHADNVIGFCDFSRTSIMQGLKSYHAYHNYRRARRSIALTHRLPAYLGMLQELADEMSAFYYEHGRQIETFAEAALWRGVDAEAQELVGRVCSFAGLMKMLVKIRRTKTTSNNLELRLLAGRVVNAARRRLLPSGCQSAWRRLKSQPAGEGPWPGSERD
ncbi:MAG TPA: glycosyltransferase [Geomonas sp.]|nr:glycosyltransferase [Geomonas sp.]